MSLRKTKTTRCILCIFEYTKIFHILKVQNGYSYVYEVGDFAVVPITIQTEAWLQRAEKLASLCAICYYVHYNDVHMYQFMFELALYTRRLTDCTYIHLYLTTSESGVFLCGTRDAKTSILIILTITCLFQQTIQSTSMK